MLRKMEAKSSSVFEEGKLSVKMITVDASKDYSSPLPNPLLIVYPLDAGKYPVVVFLHGFLLSNTNYSQLFKHIASHGFILVAPQLTVILPFSQADITGAAATTKWLSDGQLQSTLPDGVEPDLLNLALSGHSRGGHAAFSLALGYPDPETKLKFSALIGVDPVAGPSKLIQIPPKILTGKPSSFELGGMPVLVVGSGLGHQKKNILFPACAPDGVNHADFYCECRPPCYYFVAAEYGHVDMLDDNAPGIFRCACKNGSSCRDLMRKSISGLMVAFLRAYFKGESGDLKAILADPKIAPTKLDPVCYREN